jgi:uncharacterized protein with FMN-binding domain
MKRALLIAGGTVGGLGAVLAITPPQLGATSAINIAGGPMAGASAASSAPASSSPSSAVATTKATAAATKSSKPVATKSSAGATVAPATQAPATQAPATSINGTFTGPSINVNYGNVQVKITVVNGRITDAVAVVAPSGKNDRYTNMAVPVLKKQTLAAQSANIQGVSGASYTSYGWYTSLQGALAQAGL